MRAEAVVVTLQTGVSVNTDKQERDLCHIHLSLLHCTAGCIVSLRKPITANMMEKNIFCKSLNKPTQTQKHAHRDAYAYTQTLSVCLCVFPLTTHHPLFISEGRSNSYRSHDLKNLFSFLRYQPVILKASSKY